MKRINEIISNQMRKQKKINESNEKENKEWSSWQMVCRKNDRIDNSKKNNKGNENLRKQKINDKGKKKAKLIWREEK